jgi:predicted nucleic acid-binding Zn ribbon protein
MVCLSCGAPSRPGIKFCEECGTPLEIACAACSARVPPDKKFCGRILKDRSALHGERKRAHEAWTRWLLGEIDLQRGDRAAAAGQLEGARAIATELGMRPLAEQCQQTLARTA